MDDEENKRTEARDSLIRIQEFDADKLPQTAKLGETFNFSEAVILGERLIRLFQQVQAIALDEFSEAQLVLIKKHADAAFNTFSEILSFDPSKENAKARRDELLLKLDKMRDRAFDEMFSVIAYAATRQLDFASLEQDARAAIQSIKDKSQAASAELQDAKVTAEKVLDEIRSVAAEQGITQQAKYFRDAAEKFQKAVTLWQKRTIGMAVVLIGYGVLNLLANQYGWLKAETTYDLIQVTTSKILIFLVLSFLLVLFSRNYLANRHNAVVNEHRQNALLTYTTLTEAGGSAETREIVLMQAAMCIYAPQDTGFGRIGNQANSGQQASIAALVSRSALSGADPA